MTLLVRDEEDIIRENIEFHKSQGVDFFIVMDNGSIDATSNILKEYESIGILKYIWNGEERRQYQWVTQMARMAHTLYDADWVINNDADEFWWPQQGDLKETIQKIPAQYNVLRAQRHNFVSIDEDHAHFFNQMVYREEISLNPIGEALPPKVAHKGHEQIIVAPGNHNVAGMENLQIFDGDIEIFHFPIRSYEQLIRKNANAGKAYENDNTVPKSVGKARRTLYEEYKKNGNSLQDYYAQHLYNKNQIKKEIKSGLIVKDARLQNYLNSILSSKTQ